MHAKEKAIEPITIVLFELIKQEKLIIMTNRSTVSSQ